MNTPPRIPLAAACIIAAALATSATAMADPAERTGPDRLWVLAADQVTPVEEVDGSSATVVRHDRGISFTVRTAGLAPGHADTLWVMVFNHPELCTHSPRPGVQCGIADLEPFGGDPAIDSSVLYGAGHVIGSAGRATFAGSLAVEDTDGALFGNGVTNPAGAEVQFRIRDHGDAIPGLIDEQTHTFNGGCEPGQPNEGQCVDVQTSGA